MFSVFTLNFGLNNYLYYLGYVTRPTDCRKIFILSCNFSVSGAREIICIAYINMNNAAVVVGIHYLTSICIKEGFDWKFKMRQLSSAMHYVNQMITVVGISKNYNAVA